MYVCTCVCMCVCVCVCVRVWMHVCVLDLALMHYSCEMNLKSLIKQILQLPSFFIRMVFAINIIELKSVI